ncbi:MAG: ISNCY family transposase [Chloroflexi bacterium]|nr:ISNCY family transposase [Chloroflexota bacterium]
MGRPLRLGAVVAQFRDRWHSLPDSRKPNNNTQYSVGDAALSAFAVFFMQSPSFLAYQRDMNKHKGNNNARTLFKIEQIPSDNQTRNLLDPIAPQQFEREFEWVHAGLKESGTLEGFRDYGNTFLIALDGLTYFSSQKLHCPSCLTREDSRGTTHYYHSAITPVIVKPNSPHVLPLMAEFIVPQDGHEKQDCERAAAKRWLASHSPQFAPQSVTYLGDDLYANHPVCEAIAHTYQQYFVCVAKPDSHPALYEWLAMLEQAGAVECLRERRWNGTFAEVWTHRWAAELPLRAGDDALRVNWLELTLTREETGEALYHNTWVTNHAVSAATVGALAKVGRTRWKIENESNNTLKRNGYHLEHNFGHGDLHLSNVLFALNLLAFLVHTAQHLVNEPYRLLRTTLSVRLTFFNDLRALTRYMLFDSWDALFRFMLEGLEIAIPPGLFFSD